MVSTFATQSGLTLTQRVVAETSGEAEVLLPLLKGLDLAGALISLDALYARKTIAGEIVDQGADYLTGLKGNNRKDHARVVEFFSEHAFTRTGTMKAAFDAFDETHGRLVRRRAFVTDDPALIGALNGWPALTRFTLAGAAKQRSISDTS